MSTSSESLDLFEYCESPLARGFFSTSVDSGTAIAAGKGSAGRGLWLARALAPNVALVGVAASSTRGVGAGMLGAVCGRGVVGVVSSPCRL
jgi:hypothetical protein